MSLSKPLSVRECEILHLSAKGLSNAEIASLLCISRHTLKSHFDHIFNKLGAANRLKPATTIATYDES